MASELGENEYAVLIPFILTTGPGRTEQGTEPKAVFRSDDERHPLNILNKMAVKRHLTLIMLSHF